MEGWRTLLYIDEDFIENQRTTELFDYRFRIAYQGQLNKYIMTSRQRAGSSDGGIGFRLG